MPGLLDGRIALVTGAGSGIGEAIALAMGEAGARLVCVDINVGAAVRTAKAVGRRAPKRAGLACDVTDRPACDALAATVRRDIGPLSILVNNAGIIRRGKVTDTNTRRDWDDTLAVNLDGPYNMVTAFLDQLRETSGAIVNIGSIQSFVALPNSAAYTTSKGGVRMLTKALAIELVALGHPGQRDRPGLYRDAAQRRRAGERRIHGELYRPHPVRPHRHTPRHRAAGGVSSPRTWRATLPE